MECFRLLLEHLAWIEHQVLSAIRDSSKAGRLWGMLRGVGGVRKSIHQSWLAKALWLGLLCWGFKGVQEEIPSGRGHHSSKQLSDISTRTMHQSTTPSLSQTIWARWASTQFLGLPIVETLLSVTFAFFHKLRGSRYDAIEEMEEAATKVIDTLTQEDFHGAFQKWLERYNKSIAAGGDYFEGYESFMCELSLKVPIRKKSGNLFNDPRTFIISFHNMEKKFRQFNTNNLLDCGIVRFRNPVVI